jgi:hypothetical protein
MVHPEFTMKNGQQVYPKRSQLAFLRDNRFVRQTLGVKEEYLIV